MTVIETLLQTIGREECLIAHVEELRVARKTRPKPTISITTLIAFFELLTTITVTGGIPDSSSSTIDWHRRLQTFGLQYIASLLDEHLDIARNLMKEVSFCSILPRLWESSTSNGRQAILFLFQSLLRVGYTDQVQLTLSITTSLFHHIFTEGYAFLCTNTTSGEQEAILLERLLTEYGEILLDLDIGTLPFEELLEVLFVLVETKVPISRHIIRHLVKGACQELHMEGLFPALIITTEIGIPFSEGLGHMDTISTDPTTLVDILNTRLSDTSSQPSVLLDDVSMNRLKEMAQFLSTLLSNIQSPLNIDHPDRLQDIIYVLNRSAILANDGLRRKELLETGGFGLCLLLLQIAVRTQPETNTKYGHTGLSIPSYNEGYRAVLLSMLAHTMLYCPAAQEAFRLLGGLITSLQHCVGNAGCPTAREWALLALKLATDNNTGNRVALAALVTRLE
ncbi:hypothetical protein GMRT_14187 [Giardia muris]|uniref:Ataxin-10 domain-containing protein n=1 Tax=Giardia muris TaxID=5742 RepID=A0A4Z1SX04_GIAMU|nr:hypothetical protein GMRT_14187 [Giardia muris]|eukprot:TNJ30274.1 hypothetical protein GMRT_14187 [Giardia muris]